jgi:hypothetical protein
MQFLLLLPELPHARARRSLDADSGDRRLVASQGFQSRLLSAREVVVRLFELGYRGASRRLRIHADVS